MFNTGAMSMTVGQVVVITGASGGIGRATVRACAAPGVGLALLARGRRGLESARLEAEAAGAHALAIPTDVANEHEVEAAADRIERELGPIDIWINNAMVTTFGPVSALTGSEVKRATEVTYLGAVYGTLSALKRMRVRNRGTIVQVGSALAYRAIPLQAPYCAAKHALRGFTDALRCELMHDRSAIHITSVHLSAFNTPQFDWALNRVGKRSMPVPPIFQPELAASAIVWAAHHRRREVFVGWPAVKAVWGNKLFPHYADRKLVDTGYSGQMTDEPTPRDACVNLWDPCDTNPGAHGRFDGEARSYSIQWWVTRHRWQVALTVAMLVVLASLIAWAD